MRIYVVASTYYGLQNVEAYKKREDAVKRITKPDGTQLKSYTIREVKVM